MKSPAAVLYEPGQPLQIETIDVAEPKAGEVLVRMGATGLCHTDWSVISGERPHPLPAVLGHEGAGVVEATGPGVSRVKTGDHVICSWTPFCDRCFYCRENLPFWCEAWTTAAGDGVLFDGTTRLSREGQQLHHYTTVSSYAQHTVVQETSAVPVSKDIPFDRACLIGCGVMTGYGAVVRHAGVPAGRSVAVVGCGGVGLNVVQAAKIAGAEPIIAIDRMEKKLRWATDFGATHTLTAEGDPITAVKDLTQGRGADYSFEAVGHPDALVLALELARPGGKVVLLGAGSSEARVTVPYNIFRGDKSITRLTYGQGRPWEDFPHLVDLYARGELLLDELISTRLSLDQINDGFDKMLKGDVIRAVVIYD